MSDKKVKISNILGSQIPDFIQADNPLFKEFLTQYYESEEHEYGATYLAEHISTLKKISTVSDISLVEKQTINAPNSTAPESPVTTSDLIFAYDDTINVNQTTGFPEKYGLIKIDDEIITYTGKTETSFTGCVRGFSGISAIETLGNPEFLTFSETNASTHNANSLVINLSFLFVTQFFKKFKKQFLPGFDGRQFAHGLNTENILSRARDFYSSKGTDTSLKILFQVLYAEQIDVIKPFEQTIMPSEADWDVTDDIMVEVLSGNPLNLIGIKIYQDSFTNPTASGAVSNVSTKFLGNKKYYRLSFSKGTISDTFKVSTKTTVIGTASTDEVLTVDSTIGFGETGNFYYPDADNNYTLAEYTSKSSNQFFGCTGINRTLLESDPIIDTKFIYGYEDNDPTKICIMRIIGSIVSASDDVSSTKYFDLNDLIRVNHLGEKYDINDKKSNTWFYNNISFIDCLGHLSGNFTFKTETEHFLKVGDKVDIIFKESGVKIRENSDVEEIIDSKTFLIDGGIVNSPIISGDYVIKKRLNYASSNFGVPSLLSNIQNSFTDKEKNTYVAFSGFPSFDTQTTNRSHEFNSSGISSTNTNTIEITNHNFINGEKIYLDISPNSGISGSSSGFYYVKVVDNNTFNIAVNYPKLYNNSFETIKWDESGTGIHTATPANLYIGKKLSNQNNFRRIYRTPQISRNNTVISGPIGISLNGVEYNSPILDDSIVYGQIEEIQVTNSGKNFNVIQSPTLSIVDDTGTNCDAIPNFSGNLTEVIVDRPGFDYSEVPSVSVVGGNGSGAICEAKMRGFTYTKSYTEFDVNLTDNKFIGSHDFSDGEEVTYIASGTPIGINTLSVIINNVNIGFTTDKLSSGTSYFIAKYDNNSFSLANTEQQALSKTDLLDLIDDGTQVHSFRSRRIRRIIDRITVKNSGSNYDKHSVSVESQQYPPNDKKDLFKTFSGINIFNDYVYAKNHNFKNGDILEYNCNGTSISGLSTETSYKVTVINHDKFKLSDAGTATTISDVNYDRKIYVNLDSVGSGTHTFKYPDISIKIEGKVSVGSTTSIPDSYKASATPIVKGGLKNVFVKNGGVGYGVTNIINYIKTPTITFLTGKNGFITPIIVGGRIEGVNINNGGSEYTTPPELEVVSVKGQVGIFAKLKAVVSNGKIVDVNIINKGSGYNPNNTIIRITPAGSGSIITTKVKEWKINSVERYGHVLTEDNSQFVQFNSESLEYNNKICSFYPVKKYRRLLRDNLDSNNVELTENHSKIVGWAYDGNPIYGPVGVNTSGITTFMESSYELDPINDNTLRPPNYQNGYFVEDYVYKETGDLDEHNGKFVVNLDFPNGTYAYFSTIDSVTKNPTFPYITFFHRNATDLFNYDIKQNKQSDTILNSGAYRRNVSHLGLNDEFRRYPFLQDSLESKAQIKVDGNKSSNITKIDIEKSGNSYKVNDRINFNNPTISASVDSVIGKSIISVGTTNTIVDNLIFSVIDEEVTGFSTIPHGLSGGDIVEISGISSTLYKNIEGIRTIGIATVNSGLAKTIDANTGITTFISLYAPTLSRKFKIDDVIQIDNEQFLIIDYDDVNNKHRVRRAYNSTSKVSHSAGTIVSRLETKFTYSITKKSENLNAELPKVQYFEGLKSVGIGTTVSNVAVGRVGTNTGIGTIFKSIPAKAIFLPNHRFQNGDEVRIISVGSTINATENVDLSNHFNLADFDKLFCTRYNSEYIGLATEKTGIGTVGITSTSKNVFFKEVLTTGGDDHKIELIVNNISGSLRRVNGTVTVATATTTGNQHSLSVNDQFKLHITPKQTQTFNLKYNESIQKLVVNPISFIDSAIGVGTTSSKITIADHDFETGDLIVYNSSTPATPLVDNGVYYVVKDSRDTIRLSENAYDLSVFPYNYIGIGTTGGTNHEISKINPKLSFYRDNIIELVTSDSSLNNFDLEFYEDQNFKSKYNSNLITRTNDKTTVSVASSLASEFFYKIEGKDTNSTKTLFFPVDERVPNHSKIVLVESKFNKSFKVTGIGTNTFKFNPEQIAETSSYTSSGLSSAFYTTSSVNESGGIHSINILNRGSEVRKLPVITSIGTSEGVNAVLTVNADDIGRIESTQVVNPGLEFSPDNTLKPKANSNVILQLKNVLTLDSIGITSGGSNYTSPPKILAIGKPDILARTTISGTSVDTISILTNDSGLSEDLKIIPIINSNGVVVTDAKTDSFGTVTLDLRAPAPESGSDSGFFNQGGSFPFSVGDEIFVENIKISDDADGYNSSDYDYAYFTVTGIKIDSGEENVQYSLAGLSTNGGTFQVENNFGRVINRKDLAVFSPVFKETRFVDDEIVKIDGKNILGIVAKDGWDPVSETLKVFSVTGDFEKEDKIVGSLSNNKGTVRDQFKFDFDLNVGSVSTINNSWKTDIGKLNLNIQNLHDNDYYQRFSYSIKGAVPYDMWQDAVNSLDHVSGFKNFCNLGIGSTAQHTLKSDSELGLDVTIDQGASVHEKYYYDLSSEDTDDSGLSKLITLKSKIITDYNESRTNKVFLIDDISSQFNGIVTSIGGGVIGKNNFNVFADGNSLFHREFNPSTGVSTETHLVNISKHNFNTGERLLYKPHTGQSSIGIANTSDVNAGVAATTFLPSEVFAIREDGDTIKVAISATFATAGIGVSFTNVVGIANTNTLSVPSEDATIRSLITIDNVIQSPLGITTAISVGLSTEVGISTNIIFLNDTSEILGKSLLRIEDEIIKVTTIGIGTTTLNVVRGQMGTIATSHAVGAAVTVLKGDYRINEGKIYFSEAPYGPTGNTGITTFSTFSGRAYYRLNYATNKIIDDISHRFNGTLDKFSMTSNGVDMSGITNSHGAILINNVFQKFANVISSVSASDYRISGIGQTIDFTGSASDKDLPKGGRINEFDVGIGSGYQVPKKAIFTAVVSAGGTIASVGIASGGAGYLSNPLVSVSSTTGVGAAISAFVHAGIVTDVVINNPGTGYAQGGISTGINFVTVPPPSPYKNLSLDNLSGSGQGSGAKIDVVVGTGGSILSFDMRNRGIGYEVGDVLELNALPFQVGVATTTFKVTVKNKFQDKFAGWCFGQLLELDDFSQQFNGFKKSFLITRSDPDKEYYSLVAEEGSGVILQNNLLVFINDILQKPGTDYEFNGGTRITFKEAPRVGSKFRMYFYAGSSADFDSINVDETIKPGDELRLQYYNDAIFDSEIVKTSHHRIDTVGIGTSAGTGYEVGDIVRILGGSEVFVSAAGTVYNENEIAKVSITQVSSDGEVEGISLTSRGSDYTNGEKGTSGGNGSGLTLNVKIDENSKVRNVSSTTLGRKSEQENRVVYELIASDTVETTTYSGVGISTDAGFVRPLMWRKQVKDLIIDGVSISKERNYLEPEILPSTGIIKSVAPNDGKIYVKDSWAFQFVDGLDQDANNVTIVGLGTTAVVETIEKVTYQGDYGIIVGIGTSAVGINTTKPALFFEIQPQPNVGVATYGIYDPSGIPAGSKDNFRSRSGIITGDYFVIDNTFIGDGVTGIRTTSSGPETVGVGNSFLNGVYFAEHYVSVGSSTLRVFANVDSIAGIDTTTLSENFKYGNYSWGTINGTRKSNSKPFTFHNQNGLLGIETSTQVTRTTPIKTVYK